MKRPFSTTLLVVAIAAILTTKCSPRGPHRQIGSKLDSQIQSVEGVVGYDRVRPIFAAYCSACHPSRSGPDWLIYSEAKRYVANGRLLQRAVTQKTMPPQGSPQAASIHENDRELIGNWVRSGGNETSGEIALARTTEIPSGGTQSGAGNSSEILPAAKRCLECHGAIGTGSGARLQIPRIGGQYKPYLIEQLNRFKWRERIDPSNTMNEIASTLSTADINAISAYFYKYKSPYANGAPEKLSPDEWREFQRGESVAKQNCVSCHANPEYGKETTDPMVPFLNGQTKQYIINQLISFSKNERFSPLMHEYAKSLSHADIEALATFFADSP
jgi:cytochrome c553